MHLGHISVVLVGGSDKVDGETDDQLWRQLAGHEQEPDGAE